MKLSKYKQKQAEERDFFYLGVREEIKKELKAELKDSLPKWKKQKSRKGEYMLIIDPADVHIGKLSTLEETGEEYDANIAIARVYEGVEHMIESTKNYDIGKIVMVIGNDILHTDNQHTTTSGTMQDTDGKLDQNRRKATRMYKEIINRLLKIADVEIVHCPSNHDYWQGLAIADSLEMYYEGNPHVTNQTGIAHRKFVRWGENLLGFTHGDGAKEKDLLALMNRERDSSNYSTKVWYLHHMHHKRVISGDVPGFRIEYLRAVSGRDGWHDRQGYVTPASMTGFLHHKTKGQALTIQYDY